MNNLFSRTRKRAAHHAVIRNMIATARTCVCMSMLTALTLVSADASSNNRENVMRALANVKSAVVDFVEIRESGFLTNQLIVKGQMSYEWPGKLRRSVLEPFVEEILIDGDTVTLRRESDTAEGEVRTVSQRVSLESSPIARSIVESVRSTMAGDISRLEKLFKIDWQDTEESWTMILTPIDDQLQDTITSIQLTGNMSKVSTIKTVESDGDESVMTLTYLTTP